MPKKFYEIFKVGTHKGQKWSKERVQKIVDNYSTEYLKAPIIIGHKRPFEPEAPAYGYVDEVKLEDGILKASFIDVNDQFKEAVNDGKFNARSVEIFRDMDGKGPYLKAVAFLGSSAPAVKGLEVVKFSDAEADYFEFSEKAFEVNPEIEKLQAEIEILKQFEDKYKESKEMVEKFQSDLLKLEKEKKEAENKQYLEKFVDSKTLTPKQRDLSCELMKDMSEDNEKKFKEFIESLPVQFELNTEHADKKSVNTENNLVASEFSDMNVNEDELDLHNRVLTYSKENNISYEEALENILMEAK